MLFRRNSQIEVVEVLPTEPLGRPERRAARRQTAVKYSVTLIEPNLPGSTSSWFLQRYSFGLAIARASSF